MKWILYFLGCAILCAAYLYFCETWRIGCAILWFVAPVYFVAGAYLMEK